MFSAVSVPSSFCVLSHLRCYQAKSLRAADKFCKSVTEEARVWWPTKESDKLNVLVYTGDVLGNNHFSKLSDAETKFSNPFLCPTPGKVALQNISHLI